MEGIKDLKHAGEIIRQLSARLRTAIEHAQAVTSDNIALKADHGLLSEMYQELLKEKETKSKK